MSPKAGAIALIVGSLASIALMLLHPLHLGAALMGAITLNGLVHGTALVATPVTAYGFFVMTRTLGLDRPLMWLGFAFYVFGAVAIIGAATVDGLVVPQLAAAVNAADADTAQRLAPLGALAHWLNQGFAHVYVGLVSVALIAWSLGWPAKTIAGQALRAWGLIVALGVLYWQLFAGLVLNVHGMAAVTILFASWTIAAAIALLRREN